MRDDKMRAKMIFLLLSASLFTLFLPRVYASNEDAAHDLQASGDDDARVTRFLY